MGPTLLDRLEECTANSVCFVSKKSLNEGAPVVRVWHGELQTEVRVLKEYVKF
jgi:hypothetical protein